MTETRLTEAGRRVLWAADARGYATFDAPEEVEAAVDLARFGFLESWRAAGGTRAYAITPAGRALLSKGEG